MIRPGRRRPAGAPLVLGVAVALFFAPRAGAEPAVRVTVENDHFNFWQVPGERPDFGYTHGAELALRFPRAPRALARAARGIVGEAGEEALEVRVRQSLFSPWRLPPDRPYAGWLAVAIGVSRADESGFREVLLHAGVTGPPSLGSALHLWFHERFDRGNPRPDWSDQLPFEPGVGLEASAMRAASAGESGAWQARAGALARLRVGTYADDLRLGLVLSAGWAPPASWPAGRAAPGLSLYVRVAPRVDVVVRDEFLDGTLFRESRGPGTRHFIPESEMAAGAAWGRARIEYAVMRRAKEFDAQPVPHTYASLSFHWRP